MKLSPVEKLVVPDVDCKRGSPMGRPDFRAPEAKQFGALRAHRIKMVDYAYDKGGAYWGMGKQLWAIWAKSKEFNLALCLYIRADTKEEALAIAKKRF